MITDHHQLHGSPDAAGFPATRNTWISTLLDRGAQGRDELLGYVMEVYRPPLEEYFSAPRFRAIISPDDLVAGFFAQRVSRPDYFVRWRFTDKRLRQWLLNGAHFYFREAVKNRSRLPLSLDTLPQIPVKSDPMIAYERTFAQNLVRQALLHAEATCQGQGYAQHWHMFRRHRVDGATYVEIAKECGLAVARCRTMARTAEKRFIAAVRLMLLRDGAAPESVSQELHSLLESIAR